MDSYRNALFIVAIASTAFITGCATSRQSSTANEPPAAVVMPPSGIEPPPGAVIPRAPFHPAVEAPAPALPEPTSGITYVVTKGDSLGSIAYRHGVGAREIAEMNGIKDANKIRIGQKLNLPAHATTGPRPVVKKEAKAATETKKASKPKAATVAGPGEYIVKSGDSLSRIASRNETTVKALRASNNLKSDVIRIGQKLVISGSGKKAAAAEPAPVEAAPTPAPEPAAPAPAPAVTEAAAIVPPPPAPAAGGDIPFEYTIKPGESLDDVARNFAVLKQDILSYNGIADESGVSAGQKIRIPMATP